MRIKVVLLLLLCLFLLTSCCVFNTREVKHVSVDTLYELREFLDPENNYAPWDFEEAFLMLYSHFEGDERLTRREAEEYLSIMFDFTDDLLENNKMALKIVEEIK